MPIEKRLALHAQFPDAEHPVVRTHPETGEKVLFVNAFTTHFTNFHTPDNVRFGQDYTPGGAQLLQYLISQASIPEYQVRFRWKPNSMAMWDNRSTQHYAVMDYPPCHRKMERAGIIGDSHVLTPTPDRPRFTIRRTHHELPRRLPVPREPGQAGHHRRALRPRVDSLGLPGGHPGHDGSSRSRRRSTATTPAPPCCTCTCANSTARAASACPSSTS